MDSFDEDGTVNEKRSPALLRVNRQIYEEAQPIMYHRVSIVTPNEGEWYLAPNDYVYDDRISGQFPFSPHSTSTTTAETESFPPSINMCDGYWSPPRWQVNMLPGERFQRACLAVHLDLVSRRRWQRLLYQGEESTMAPALQQWVTRELSKQEPIRSFVEEAKNTHWIDHLDIDLYAMTRPHRSQRMMDDDDDERLAGPRKV